LTLSFVAARPRRRTRPRNLVRRRVRVKQLSLLDLPHARGRMVIWSALDDEQRAEAVARLARVIAQAVNRAPVDQGEDSNE
jgi:hypothetical protein